MQLRKNKIRFSKINHIFISHLHGDHVFGLLGLLSSLSLMGRKAILHLYAPKNYQQILHSQLRDFDINLSFEIDFIGLSGKGPIQILDDKYISVTAFPLQHRVPAFGFMFMEKLSERTVVKALIDKYNIPVVRIPSIKKGEDFVTPEGVIINNEEITLPPAKQLSYAYCSDTKYFKKLASYVKDVTLLYHEATFDKSKKELASFTGHSTTVDAATTALHACAGTLLIGHFSSRYRNNSFLVDEARSVFPETHAAKEGMIFDIRNIDNL